MKAGGLWSFCARGCLMFSVWFMNVLSLLQCIFLVSLLRTSWLWMCRFISGNSICPSALVSVFMPAPWCFSNLDLWYGFGSQVVMPPTLGSYCLFLLGTDLAFGGSFALLYEFYYLKMFQKEYHWPVDINCVTIFILPSKKIFLVDSFVWILACLLESSAWIYQSNFKCSISVWSPLVFSLTENSSACSAAIPGVQELASSLHLP